MERRSIPLLLLATLILGCNDHTITDPRPKSPTRPSAVLLEPGTVAQVSAGGFHSCALRTEGSIACWGDDFFGQTTPPSGIFTQVSAGRFHSCALRPDTSIACWGSGFGALTPAGSFTQVSASGGACALATDGSVQCWGYFPAIIPPAATFTQVSAGWDHEQDQKRRSTGHRRATNPGAAPHRRGT